MIGGGFMKLKCICKTDVCSLYKDQTSQVFIYSIPDFNTFIKLNESSNEERCDMCGLQYESREFFDKNDSIIYMMHKFYIENELMIVTESKGYKKGCK